MMEWEEAETREEMADGFFNFCIFFFTSPLSSSSSQTFGELCSNVTLFICLRISDCQTVSSQGFTVGSPDSSMF